MRPVSQLRLSWSEAYKQACSNLGLATSPKGNAPMAHVRNISSLISELRNWALLTSELYRPIMALTSCGVAFNFTLAPNFWLLQGRTQRCKDCTGNFNQRTWSEDIKIQGKYETAPSLGRSIPTGKLIQFLLALELWQLVQCQRDWQHRCQNHAGATEHPSSSHGKPSQSECREQDISDEEKWCTQGKICLSGMQSINCSKAKQVSLRHEDLQDFWNTWNGQGNRSEMHTIFRLPVL